MRRHLKLLVFALVAGPVVTAVGCDRFQASAGGQTGPSALLPDKTAKRKSDGSSTPGQEAIVRVLETDKEQFTAGYNTLQTSSQPSEVGKFIGSYVAHLEQSDAGGCPFEFREARKRHAQAWALLKTVIERHPDAYDDVEFMDSLGHLFRGEKTRGRKLGGDVIDAVARVIETHGELYKLAEGYGVEIE